MGLDRARVLREQSNRVPVQAAVSSWKATKAQACDLESKGQLHAALNLINEAIKQSDQPSHEMIQYDSLLVSMLDVCWSGVCFLCAHLSLIHISEPTRPY